jgi:hypothetical protein
MLSHRILPNNSGIQPDFRLGVGMPALTDIPTSITINSVTKTPTCCYLGNDATASAWPSYGGYGPTLGLSTVGTVAPVSGKYAPITGTCPKFTNAAGGGKCYASAAGAVADYTMAADFVIEAIIEFDATSTGTGAIIGVRDGLYGVEFLVDAGPIIYLFLGDGTDYFLDTSSAIPSGWNIIHLFVDTSAGHAGLYVNGAAHKDFDFSASSLNGALGNGSLWGIGGWPEHTEAHMLGGKIAWIADWRGADWLDTHLQAAVAKERASSIMGIYATKAGTQTPSTKSRSTSAYLDRYVTQNDRQIFQVGANWIRTVERKDSSSVTLTGVLIEPQSENEIVQSEDFSGWDLTRATITSNSSLATAPDGTQTADGIVANDQENTHFIGKDLGHDSGLQVFSFFARIGSKTWCYVDIPHIVGATAYFGLGTGVVGTVGAACRAYIEPWGNGGWNRIEVAYEGAASPHTHRIYAAQADGDNVYTGDNSTIDIFVWGAQHEDGRERASSYIKTAAAAVTRVKDQLQYASSGSVTAGTGTITAKVLGQSARTLAGAVCAISNTGSADNKFQLDITTARMPHCTSVVSAGVQASIVGTLSALNGTIHRLHTQWASNDVRLYADSVSQGTRDTSCTIASGLTVIDVGQDTAAANQIGAVINELRIYRKPLKG